MYVGYSISGKKYCKIMDYFYIYFLHILFFMKRIIIVHFADLEKVTNIWKHQISYLIVSSVSSFPCRVSSKCRPSCLTKSFMPIEDWRIVNVVYVEYSPILYPFLPSFIHIIISLLFLSVLLVPFLPSLCSLSFTFVRLPYYVSKKFLIRLFDSTYKFPRL